MTIINFIIISSFSLLTIVLVFLMLIQYKKILSDDFEELKHRIGRKLVISFLITITIICFTQLNICSFLYTPLGAMICLFSCVLGLIWGVWRFLKDKQLFLMCLWIVFFLPALFISYSGISEYLISLNGTVVEKMISKGTIDGTHTFKFKRHLFLTVEGKSVNYIFKHYSGPSIESYGMLDLPRGIINNYTVLELQINGKLHKVSSFVTDGLSVDGVNYMPTHSISLGDLSLTIEER